MDSALSILPPLAAIALALISRQVFLSLFAGVWMGWTILSDWNPLLGLSAAIEALVKVFGSAYNTRVILFSALIGGLITLTQRSGGVKGFIQWMQARRLGRSRRSVGLVAAITGILIFVESSITCLVVGAVSRPLADKNLMSREKLAYICDSTSAPVCILIPLNAWGAYIMGLLALQGVEAPLSLMLASIPLNFYAWIALIWVFFIIFSGRDWGPMRRAERRAQEEGKLLADGAVPMIADEIIAVSPAPGVIPQAHNLLLPMLVMVTMMPLGLFITGREAILKRGGSLEFFAIMGEGSGSIAVLWAVLAALSFAALSYRLQGLFKFREIIELILKGAGGLMPMAVIMMLAFALNSTCSSLGTGRWIAEASREFLSAAYLSPVLFLISAGIAFSTGTSWGTFGIMTPIAIPLSLAMGGSLPLSLAAVLSGGVFGDHCSPISDTTVISSMATACDHIDHVRSQLPYALWAASLALLAFLIAGQLSL